METVDRTLKIIEKCSRAFIEIHYIKYTIKVVANYNFNTSAATEVNKISVGIKLTNKEEQNCMTYINHSTCDTCRPIISLVWTYLCVL